MLFEVIIFIITIIASYWVYAKYNFTYWKKNNIPYLEPSFPFGNLENPFTRKDCVGIWMQKLYNDFRKRKVKHGGIYLFSTPAYLVVDPEILKNILQKHFQNFVDRGFYFNEKDDPLSAHLFAIGGHKWRHLRTKLTPTFTSGKMKMMFYTLVQCGKQMEEAVEEYYKTKEPLDIRNILACFTTDVIGSCAFGLDCNCFKNPNAEFRKYGRKIFEFPVWDGIKLTFAFHNPDISRKLGISFFPKDATDFFMKIVKDTINYRERNNVVRKDMLQLLINMKKADVANKEEKPLTIEEIAAQAFVFFAAGFETSSTTMTFALYELAANPDIQKKVREEIKQVLDKNNDEITYDGLMEMKYMERVINETLRKYPPIAEIGRECVKDYKLPDSEVMIQKGTKILVSILGLHKDPEYYPNPEKFDPDRFTEDNRKSAIPFTYIPFGEGPRLCLGMRFGIMQTKIGLTMLLKNYQFSVNKKTTLPFVMNPFSFTLLVKGGIWLDIEKINN